MRVRRIPAIQNAAALALEVVNHILAGAGLQSLATIRSAHDDDSGGPVIDIASDDSGLLIGRRGETLRAFQFLVNLIVKNKLGDQSVRVMLDVERYRERRYSSLRDLAMRVADRVSASGRPQSLEPMPAAERRMIHLALADHPRVSTESVGVGETRQITINPKRPD